MQIHGPDQPGVDFLYLQRKNQICVGYLCSCLKNALTARPVGIWKTFFLNEKNAENGYRHEFVKKFLYITLGSRIKPKRSFPLSPSSLCSRGGRMCHTGDVGVTTVLTPVDEGGGVCLAVPNSSTLAVPPFPRLPFISLAPPPLIWLMTSISTAAAAAAATVPSPPALPLL